MPTTTPSTTLVPLVPVFSPAERLALAGFLAGYSGLTRQAYELDLRQFASWWNLCRRRHKFHYADLPIMPTRLVPPLVAAA
jgi:hypothetical protein